MWLRTRNSKNKLRPIIVTKSPLTTPTCAWAMQCEPCSRHAYTKLMGYLAFILATLFNYVFFEIYRCA